MQDYDPTPKIADGDDYKAFLQARDICSHCGKNEWDGECIWCEPNDEDDSSKEDADHDQRLEQEHELSDYHYQTGDWS